MPLVGKVGVLITQLLLTRNPKCAKKKENKEVEEEEEKKTKFSRQKMNVRTDREGFFPSILALFLLSPKHYRALSSLPVPLHAHSGRGYKS